MSRKRCRGIEKGFLNGFPIVICDCMVSWAMPGSVGDSGIFLCIGNGIMRGLVSIGDRKLLCFGRIWLLRNKIVG